MKIIERHFHPLICQTVETVGPKEVGLSQGILCWEKEPAQQCQELSLRKTFYSVLITCQSTVQDETEAQRWGNVCSKWMNVYIKGDWQGGGGKRKWGRKKYRGEEEGRAVTTPEIHTDLSVSQRLIGKQNSGILGCYCVWDSWLRPLYVDQADPNTHRDLPVLTLECWD